MFVRRLSTLATISTLAFLNGCVVAPPRDRVVYAQQPMQRQVPVYDEYGRVENIGYVQVSQRPSGAGAVLGAVIGGVGISSWGVGNIGYVSAVIAVLAALLVPLVAKLAPAGR